MKTEQFCITLSGNMGKNMKSVQFYITLAGNIGKHMQSVQLCTYISRGCTPLKGGPHLLRWQYVRLGIEEFLVRVSPSAESLCSVLEQDALSAG